MKRAAPEREQGSGGFVARRHGGAGDSLELVFSLGGALVLILDTPLAALPRRAQDGTVVVPQRHVKKNLLAPGRALRLRRSGARGLEAQWRWQCPEYADCCVAYQLREWGDSGNQHLLLFPDVVFGSAEEALKEVVRAAPAASKQLPRCFRQNGSHGVLVAVEPDFALGGGARCEYRDGGRLLAIRLDCAKTASEASVNAALIRAASLEVFKLSSDLVAVEWDSVAASLALLVKRHSPVQLHLAALRAMEQRAAPAPGASSSSSSSSRNSR